jgi:immune inhibitor A
MPQLRRAARDHQDLVARIVRLFCATLFALCLAGSSGGSPVPNGGLSGDTPAFARPRASVRSSASRPTHDVTPLLGGTLLPARDDAALAMALGLYQAETAFDPWLASERPGDRASFWVADLEAGQMRRIGAVCVAVGRHASMWLDQELDIDATATETATRSLDTLIYPTVRRALGGTALPRDGRVAILHAKLSGGTAYVARGNMQPAEVYEYSNERALVIVNVSHVQPGDDAYLAALAHELQHLAQYLNDPMEDAWFNEGLSQLAEDVCGFEQRERGASLFAHPDHPLLRWHSDAGLAQRDYAASYLFTRYLADRFGLATVTQIAQHPERATDSIDTLLAPHGGMDGLFSDWLVANLVADPTACEAGLAYESAPGHITPIPLDANPKATIRDTVANYGADYWSVDLADATQLHIAFAGDNHVSLGPERARKDEHVWWSQRGDGMHTWLETTVDLRALVTATLDQELWFEIEPGWDYAYLRISADDGATWNLLATPSASAYDPLGYALGPAYTGASGCPPDDDGCEPRWISERVELDRYCGEKVRLRWDYITDEAVTGAGLFIGETSLIGITRDRVLLRETLDASGPPATARMAWKANGFLRTTTLVPQSWRLLVVEMGKEIKAHHVLVGPDGKANWSLSSEAMASANPTQVVVIVAATHRLSDGRPSYRLSVEKLP